MRSDILSPEHRPLLGELAASRLLLAFDYDGVLAPLATTPEEARMRPSTRQWLARTAKRYPTAVVSGRAYRYLRRSVGGVVALLVGNHGFELGRATRVPPSVLARVADWRRQLSERLADVPGVMLEDKRSTLSIHYALSPDRRRAARAVLVAAQELHGARLVPGKKVVNVLPAHFPTKGDAVREMLARCHLETALYVGDDVTDEDAFAIGRPAVVGVRVGRGRTLAPYRLEGQSGVDDLLRLLWALRSPGGATRRSNGRKGGKA